MYSQRKRPVAKSRPNRKKSVKSEKTILDFSFCSFIREKREKCIYAVEFNHFLKAGEPNVFAAVGGNRISVYECHSDDNSKIKLVQCYEVPDESEVLYTCCWSFDAATRKSILVVGGFRCIIRILCPELSTAKQRKHFVGHGAAINQLKVPSKNPFLLASASKDCTIRLWNLQTNVCIAIFHSDDPNRNGVISIDFDFECTQIVSGGSENKLAIWDLTSPEISSAIEASRMFDVRKTIDSFETAYHPFNVFSTNQLHTTFIDCVKFFGDFIISKSCGNDLVCWKRGFLKQPDAIKKAVKSTCSILHRFDVADCTNFFTRFALNSDRTVLALGNNFGVVTLWNVDVPGPEMIRETKLSHRKRKSGVRDITFSRCGRILIFCCDNGTIWQYERK